MRIGIDLGGTKIEGALVNDAGVIVSRFRRGPPASDGYDAIVAAICEVSGTLEHQHGGEIRGFGLGVPGPICRRTGELRASNTKCLTGKPLGADVQDRLGREVRVANDANCFALSEAIGGAADGMEVVLGVILGTGVGGGVVFGGRAHQGPNGIAGEWGHMPLDAGGPACYCGGIGCVESLVSGPAIARDHATNNGGTEMSAVQIADAALSGDAAAVATIARFTERLGRALATALDLLDPDVVVLGGGLSAILSLYKDLPPIIRRHVYAGGMDTPILQNQFGGSGVVRGAAMLWP